MVDILQEKKKGKKSITPILDKRIEELTSVVTFISNNDLMSSLIDINLLKPETEDAIEVLEKILVKLKSIKENVNAIEGVNDDSDGFR